MTEQKRKGKKLPVSLKTKTTYTRRNCYWKMNNFLLTDDVYIKVIEDLITSTMLDLKKYLQYAQIGWESLKCYNKDTTITYSILKSKETNNHKVTDRIRIKSQNHK